LRELAPFQSDSSLRDEFFDMFDCVEVLPASLSPEYAGMVKQGNIIEADSLLVPISSGQWAGQRASGTARMDGEGLRVLDVPYDEEYGLQL